MILVVPPLGLESQHVRKTGRPIRTQEWKQRHVTSMRTGTPPSSNCQVYMLALESAQGGRTKVKCHMTFIAYGVRACDYFHYAHAVSCSALLEHFSVCLQQVCPNQYSADFTLLQVQVKYTLTRHCHSSENQLKLPYFRINHHGKRRLLKWPLDMLEEQIRLLFRRFNLCTTGTVWPCEEDETSALQVALA